MIESAALVLPVHAAKPAEMLANPGDPGPAGEAAAADFARLLGAAPVAAPGAALPDGGKILPDTDAAADPPSPTPPTLKVTMPFAVRPPRDLEVGPPAARSTSTGETEAAANDKDALTSAPALEPAISGAPVVVPLAPPQPPAAPPHPVEAPPTETPRLAIAPHVRSAPASAPVEAGEPKPVPALPAIALRPPMPLPAMAIHSASAAPLRPAVNVRLNPAAVATDARSVQLPRKLAELAGELPAPLVEPVSALSAPVGQGPTPAPAGPPATSPQPSAQRPHDFALLVDQLVAAREAAGVQPVSIVVPNVDFGPVSLRFEQQDDRLNVALASADPDFARAVNVALPAQAFGGGHDPAASGHSANAQPRAEMAGSGTSHSHGQGTSQREGNSQPRGNAPSLQTRREPRASRDGIFA